MNLYHEDQWQFCAEIQTSKLNMCISLDRTIGAYCFKFVRLSARLFANLKLVWNFLSVHGKVFTFRMYISWVKHFQMTSLWPLCDLDFDPVYADDPSRGMVYYKHILFKVYFYLFIIMYSVFVLFLTRNLNCASVQIVDDVGTVSIKLNYTLKSLAIIFPPSIIRLIISLVSLP